MLKNKELDLAWNFAQFTNRNIFLTGNAGTGKTTFLKSLKQKSHKRIIITAPTGVAAINAGGVTLHSFFQLSFGPILTESVTGKKPANRESAFKFNKKKINIIKTLDLLVIDEISMVRADMLDAIDEVLRKYRDRTKPFGGVQLLMIGDLEQLAPVVNNDEWNLLRDYYSSIFFFHSKAILQSNIVTIELKHIYRQADESFIEILNEIRNNNLSEKSIALLNQRYIPTFEPTDDDEYIILTTHNATADKINQKQLAKIKTKEWSFNAEIEGIFSEYSYPTDYKLTLKENAQVMFVKNDSSYEKKYFNGKIGTVISIENDGEILVQCDSDEDPILVSKETWHNVRYTLDNKTGELKEEILGSFNQYPLRLAWAITIHKSQGLTFEKAVIDSEAAFAHGQTYVALSRCKSLEGLVLSSKIGSSSLKSDKKISEFNQKMKENQPSETELMESRYNFQCELISELFSYRFLTYHLNKLEGVLSDNQKVVFGKLLTNTKEIQKSVLPELIITAGKFIVQANQILNSQREIEKNDYFHERISKAANYFLEQHQNRIITLLDIGFETDNKEIKKNINEELEKINEFFNIRQAMLLACKEGFDLSKILKARAEGTLKGEINSKPKNKQADISTNHQELYSLISYWRKETARETGVSLNQVLLQRTMIEISNRLPRNKFELKKVPGVGKVTIRNYGDDIIQMVEEYIETKNLKSVLPTKIEKEKRLKTHDESWQLLQSGLSISEVATRRNLAVSTIETHILKCIDKDDFNFQHFIEKAKILKILEFYHEHPEYTITDAKTALGDEISWFELRLINTIREKINQNEQEE